MTGASLLRSSMQGTLPGRETQWNDWEDWKFVCDVAGASGSAYSGWHRSTTGPRTTTSSSANVMTLPVTTASYSPAPISALWHPVCNPTACSPLKQIARRGQSSLPAELIICKPSGF